jgi:hypothetical protein
MRTTWWMMLALVACGEKDAGDGGGDGGDADTDADTDSDTDTDTDADTDADTDTDVTDTDPPTTTEPMIGDGLPVRTPGCAPEWVTTEVSYADCTSSSETFDVLAGNGQPYATEEVEYDAEGRVIRVEAEVFPAAYASHTIDTYTYDPTTGDVAMAELDLDGDGRVDVTEVYTWTYDIDGNPTEIRTDATDEATGAVTSSTATYTWGTCGAELGEYDNDADGTVDDSTEWLYFDDGDRTIDDVGADGAPELMADWTVDPVSGEPVSYGEDNYAGSVGYDYELYYTGFDPVGGWITDIEGFIDLASYGYAGNIDIFAAYEYDPAGRPDRFTVLYELGGMPYIEEETRTSWSCPP